MRPEEGLDRLVKFTDLCAERKFCGHICLMCGAAAIGGRGRRYSQRASSMPAGGESDATSGNHDG